MDNREAVPRDITLYFSPDLSLDLTVRPLVIFASWAIQVLTKQKKKGRNEKQFNSEIKITKCCSNPPKITMQVSSRPRFSCHKESWDNKGFLLSFCCTDAWTVCITGKECSTETQHWVSHYPNTLHRAYHRYMLR